MRSSAGLFLVVALVSLAFVGACGDDDGDGGGGGGGGFSAVDPDGDIDDGSDDLYCSEGKCTLRWVLTDTCDDGIGPYVEFYDIDKKVYWGTYWIQTYNTPLYRTLLCEKGHQICLGAWDEAGYWGCGEDCEQGCDACCIECVALEVSKTLSCGDGQPGDDGDLYCQDGECIMRWVLTDACDDGQAPRVEFYDVDANGYWGTYRLQTYDTPLQKLIRCEAGHKICYGAWVSGGYWGCGEDCQYGCDACCASCDAVEKRKTLTCE